MREIAPRIIIDPEIQGGKPVIKGTRIPVDLILGKIAGGIAFRELKNEYDLKRENILAAINYTTKVNKKYAKNE